MRWPSASGDASPEDDEVEEGCEVAGGGTAYSVSSSMLRTMARMLRSSVVRECGVWEMVSSHLPGNLLANYSEKDPPKKGPEDKKNSQSKTAHSTLQRLC